MLANDPLFEELLNWSNCLMQLHHQEDALSSYVESYHSLLSHLAKRMAAKRCGHKNQSLLVNRPIFPALVSSKAKEL